MGTDRYHRLNDAFARAISLPGDERARFLEELGRQDVDLLREVEDLLDRDGAQDGRLRVAVAGNVEEALNDRSLRLPERIGPYEILDFIGRGGMGVVYRARQKNPDRIVALKVLRPAVFAEKLEKRFELEKQVLARLQHPGIAQIHEAGTTDLGAGTQPWFAMELIDGRTLTEWAEDKSTREKLELVVELCDAVQHAHLRGVVHRDLKPDNILIGADGRPKVLDFGVARVTNSDVQVTTILTDARSLIGTLPYMSPEQAQGETDKVHAPSDVYALGVLTYELLTGGLPYDLRDKSVAAAARIIADDDPTPLSSVDRMFQGDLETIVGKALEKEPERRYATAEQLALDIQRFLSNEPIRARPPSMVYQLRKFATRNRGLVAGLVATFAILVAAVVGLSVLSLKAQRAADVAESKVAIAEAVNGYMLRVLGAGSQYEDGPNTTIGSVLDRASESVDGAFPDDPDVECAVRMMLAEVYLENPLAENRVEKAEDLIERTLLLAERLDSDPATKLRARHLQGRVIRIRNDFQGVVDHYEDLTQEVLDTLGPDHELYYVCISYCAVGLMYVGRPDEAYDLVSKHEPQARVVLGEDHIEYLKIRGNMLAFAGQAGDYETALRVAEENLELKSTVLEMDAYNLLFDRLNTARLMRLLGRYAEAEIHLQAVWAGWEERLGGHVPDVLITMRDLARLYGDWGRFDDGLDLSTRLVERIALIDKTNPSHHSSWLIHSWMLLEAGRIDEAEEYCQRAQDGELSEPESICARYVRARIEIERGRTEAGELALAEIRADADDALLPGDPFRERLALESDHPE